MPKPPKPAPKPRKTSKASLANVQNLLDELPDAYNYAFRPWRLLWYSFLKGIAYGLGILAVAVFVIPMILWMLRSVSWVPLIGNFISEIVVQVERTQGR